VIGLGLLGLLTVGIATVAGCQVLGVDLDPDRVRFGEIMGADGVLRDQAEMAANSFTQGHGCDSVLVCADSPSSDPMVLAGTIARDRATVVATGAVGLEIPRKTYYEKELSLIVSRSYGPGRYDPSYEEGGQDYPIGYVRWTEGRNLAAFVDLLASGKLDVHPLITHRFPIEQAPEAYQLITGKRDERFLGVLLTYREGNRALEEETLIDEQEITREDGRQKIPQVSPLAPEYRHPDTCKLGVLGAGNFSTGVLLPAIRSLPNVEFVGIVSASGLNARHAAQRFGFHYADSDEKVLLDDPKINTIAVLTRHDLHARQVLNALKAGKHVFCEKPLAIDSEALGEIEAVLNAMENPISGDESSTRSPASPFPLLMVGFNRRFAPMATRLQAFFAKRSEPLVAHYRVNAGYLPLTHWLHDPQQGGGRIIGEGCHFVDFLTFLVGQPPESVSARGLPDMSRYREDNIVLSFSFPDGSLGSLTYLSNGDKALPKERLEVFAAGRVGILDDFRKLELVSNGRRALLRSHLRQDKGHRAEWEAFSKAILSGGPPPIPYEHLIGVTKATFAAVDSLRFGEQVTISK
jgi:predicted dehydrogenase